VRRVPTEDRSGGGGRTASSSRVPREIIIIATGQVAWGRGVGSQEERGGGLKQRRKRDSERPGKICAVVKRLLEGRAEEGGKWGNGINGWGILLTYWKG